MTDDDKTRIVQPDDADQDKNLETRIDDEDINTEMSGADTVFSETHVNDLITKHGEKPKENTAESDATQIMDATSHGPETKSSTVLSATEVEQLETRHQQDPDATALLKNKAPADDDATEFVTDETRELSGQTEATILAGGTEAVKKAVKPAPFNPRIGIGSVVKDRFTLEKLLGRGGMGEVYLASDKRKIEAQDKNPYVAFKVLGESFKKHPQAFIALQREARKTQELAHPNIVTVYDFDRQGDTVYITMEAMRGKPMDEEIRSDVRPLEEAIKIINQCANGLAYAHHKNLVHSDLKPGNLFLTEDGNVKLLDFGIARAFKSGKELEDSPDGKDDTVFDAGELGALTPAYASLEMIEGEEPHPSDDVYALGLIAYELCTGKHPFDKKMASKAMEMGLEPEPIEGLSKNQWRAIEKALAFKREDRIQNAQEFLDLFTAISKTPFYIAGVLILAAFIGLGSYTYFKPPEEVLGPEVPFEQLPTGVQSSIQQKLKEADTLMGFGAMNEATQMLSDAFELHPYNREVMDKFDKVLTQWMDYIDTLPGKKEKLKYVNTLLSYKALEKNPKLLEYQKKLENTGP